MDAPSLAEPRAETPAVADGADPAIYGGPPPGDATATHRRDAGGPPAAPSVVAVVVVGRGGASLDDCLGSLSRQDYPNITLLILDNSPVEEPPRGDAAAVGEDVGGLPGVVAPESETKPETGLTLSDRVAAAAPGSYVKRLERSSSYGAAANEVLATVQGADYLYFCHDDVASAPDAVRLLVEEAQRSGAAMVGPKIVRWDDHDRLLAVGMGVDKTAFMVPIVEPGELDQAQHDGSREVVAVPGTAFLIRTPIFASVGGFDERLFDGVGVDKLDVGEDVDLGWRVRLTGESVVTAPIARVAHAQRESPIRSNRRATVLRNRLRITLKNTDVLRLPGAFAALLVQSIGSMVVGFFRSGRPEISMHASAWWWNIIHGPDIVGRRRTIHRGNRRFERPVRHSLLPASARLRAVLRDEAADDTAKVWSGLAGGVRSLTKRGPQRWVMASVFFTAAVTVIGSRRLFADLPLFRQFQPLPATGALWRHLQARGAVSPAFAVLTVVRFFLRSWAASAIVLVMVPLGLIGAWRLAMVVYGDLTGNITGDITGAEKIESEIRPDEQMTHWAAASVRIITVLGYGLVPLPYNAIAAGRWDGLVAYGFAPWVLRSLWRSASLGRSFDPAIRDRNRRWLAILRVGLPTALAAAFAPTLLLLVLVVTAAMAAGQLLVGGRWRESGRMVEAGIGGVALAMALLLPWSFGFFAHPRQSGFVPGLGRLPQGPDGAGRLLELLAFRNGPAQLGWLGIGLFGAAALSLFAAKGAEWQWIVRLWTVAIAAFGVAWAAQRGWLGPGQRVLGPSVVLAPAALSLALAAAIGLAGFLLRARQASFGWRQLLAPVTVVVFTFGLLPTVWAARSGSWSLPRTAWNDSLGWLDRPTVWIGDADALVLPGHLLTGTTRAGIAPAGVPDVRLLWPSGGALAEGFVAAQIQEAVTQKTSRLGARLRSSGIGYIVVIERPAPGLGRRIAVPDAVRAGLDAQLDLQQVERTSDLTVYRNSAFGADVVKGGEFPSTRTRMLLGASAIAWLWAISRWRRTARATSVGSTTASEAPEPASAAPAVDSYLTSSTDAFSEESDELFSTPAAGSLANEMYESLRRRRGVRAPRSKERS